MNPFVPCSACFRFSAVQLAFKQKKDDVMRQVAAKKVKEGEVREVRVVVVVVVATA